MKTKIKQHKFWGLFTTNTHGCSGECHCGILHYDTANEWDDDHKDNTLPRVLEAEKEHPELYQLHDTAIAYLDFNGMLYVIGCRCETDELIFSVLNEDKESVLNYYKQTEDKISLDDVLPK